MIRHCERSEAIYLFGSRGRMPRLPAPSSDGAPNHAFLWWGRCPDRDGRRDLV